MRHLREGRAVVRRTLVSLHPQRLDESMQDPTPVVETGRLLLRGHRPGDLDDCAAIWADAEVARYTTGSPLSREEVWSRLLRYIGHWTALGYGIWAVEEKSTGRYLGNVGFADFKREMTPALGDTPEAAWVLAPWSHGRGFATEAVRAAQAWLERTRGPSSVCIISPENAASIQVAAKCGYRAWRRSIYRQHEVIVFRHEAP